MAVDERNRMIVAPYPRLVVSRDLVNQGAAVVLTSVADGRAPRHRPRPLGVPARPLRPAGAGLLRPARPRLGADPARPPYARRSDLAGTALDDVDFLDLYSCFPFAVSQLLDGLGLEPDDPRGLTLTGGLPFFGGPGNNYSLHAIAEVVARTRAEPGTVGVVSANGGTLSKVSVGVYSTAPRAVARRARTTCSRRRSTRGPRVPLDDQPADGWATVETWTVRHGRSGRTGVVVGRTARGAASSPPACPATTSSSTGSRAT